MALCKPALLYLAISLIALFIMFLQNFANVDMYCLGTYSCGVYSTWLVFLVKLAYILFWTWLLNIICDKINPIYAWFLVVFPFMLMFGFIALMILNNLTSVYKGFTPSDLYDRNRTWEQFYSYFIRNNWALNRGMPNLLQYLNPMTYMPKTLLP
jgi:hypothetical protein